MITTESPRGRVIALCGLKGAGKSEVAYALSHGLTAARVRFAGPLKDMLRALGLSEHEIEGRLKERPSEKLCGQTPRHAMLTLGTEWGRQMIGDNIWVEAWRRVAEQHLACGTDVIVEDLRFPNEYQAIREAGGIVIRVNRPDLAIGEHESERHALTFAADIIVSNDGELEDLIHYAYHVLRDEIGRAFAIAGAAR